jgi:tetratricopeptide (TPR) repeat protein
MTIELFNEGLRYQQSGALARAEQCYRQALGINPLFVDALGNLGIVLKAQGQRLEAGACFRRALEINPNYFLALNNLAILHAEAGQLNEAEAWFREIIRGYPGQASAHYNLGNLLLERGQLDEAIPCFSQALRLNPNYADAYCNLGNCYKDQGNLPEAAQCYRSALGIKPNDAECHGNLANVLKDQGELAEAAAEYEQALLYEPNHANVRLNRALLRLLQGEFERGWPDYEFRWHVLGTPARQFVQPIWDGTSLLGRTILLYAEQGLGDTIHFIRYAALVKNMGATVIFESPPALVPLLKAVPGVDVLIPSGQALPFFHCRAPLLSLPGLLGTTLTTVPAEVPYVTADRQRVLDWQEEIRRAAQRQAADFDKTLKIGIVWQGNPAHKDDRYRSFALTQLEPLARRPQVTLVSLQKGPGTEQIAALGGRFAVVDLGDRLDKDGAFLDTAAIMKNLDLVVAVDSAVAHLAGALGVPIWLATSYVPDWRWLLDREDCPWYPTMRLFRQRRPGAWRDVFERMAAAIGGDALHDLSPVP